MVKIYEDKSEEGMGGLVRKHELEDGIKQANGCPVPIII